MAKQATTKITKRAFTKDLSIKFGVMETVGHLYTPLVPNAKKDEKFRKVCSTCALAGDAVPVAQRYICTEHPDEHGLMEPSETQSAKEVNKDDLVLVDKDLLAEAKEASELPAKTLILSAHDAAQVEPYMVHTGSTYVFAPDGDSQFYGILHRIIDEAGYVQTDTGPKVLMGQMLVRSDEKVFRVTKWNSQIVIQEVARPEDIDSFTPTNVEVEDKLVVLTKMLVETGTEEFVPETYRKTVRDRYSALVEAAGDGAPLVSPIKEKAGQSVDDLAALLEQAIAANASK
jgi:non-homologous end joining protein Ku